jgi:hypothetical protein
MRGPVSSITDGRAANGRKRTDFVRRIAGRANGAPERISAAQDKRDRKAAKRARDAEHANLGEVSARYRLETGHLSP